MTRIQTIANALVDLDGASRRHLLDYALKAGKLDAITVQQVAHEVARIQKDRQKEARTGASAG